MAFKTIVYSNARLKIIDQRALPQRVVFKECRNIKDVHHYIKTLAVRGAPAIGVFAAYGICVGLRSIRLRNRERFLKELMKLTRFLKTSRPTAINLFWAIDRMEQTAFRNSEKQVDAIKDILIKEAKRIHREDQLMCDNIGSNGARLIKSGDSILTHCNAGALATSGIGTALAVIYKAKQQGKRIKVYVDETRPLLQGARLTAWELKNKGIDLTLICDNMAASIMAQGKIDKIIVGADRIAANGDTANKIGTYSLALLARAHNIPFYVAAPSSTFDLSLKDGRAIPIEEREPDEVRGFMGVSSAPKGVKAYNPAFDITPNRLIKAIITEKGLFKKPYKRALKKLNRA